MNEKVIQIIFDVVDEVNEELPEESRLEKSPDTVLFGESGKLDSLGLVNLVVAVEENLEDEFGKAISLTDEKAMSQKRSPFKTVKTLAEYITTLLEEKDNS